MLKPLPAIPNELYELMAEFGPEWEIRCRSGSGWNSV